MKNSCLEIALRELEAAGVRGIEQSRGSKHLQIRWRVNGRPPRFYVLPCTPSDIRSPRNVRAEVRQLLRQDGALPTPYPKTAAAKMPDRFTVLERRVAALEQQLDEIRSPITAKRS